MAEINHEFIQKYCMCKLCIVYGTDDTEEGGRGGRWELKGGRGTGKDKARAMKRGKSIWEIICETERGKKVEESEKMG